MAPNVIPLSQLRQWMKDHPHQGFKVAPYYSDVGKFLTVHFTDDLCHAERLTDQVDVYRSEKTGEIVGCKLYGVERLIEEAKEVGS